MIHAGLWQAEFVAELISPSITQLFLLSMQVMTEQKNNEGNKGEITV